MVTIYLSRTPESTPERIDYTIVERFSGVYDKQGGPLKETVIEAWHVEGYNYQERNYIGQFNSLKELEDMLIVCEII